MTNTDNLKNASRQVRYTAEPLAIKDYNQDRTTTLGEVVNSKVFLSKYLMQPVWLWIHLLRLIGSNENKSIAGNSYC